MVHVPAMGTQDDMSQRELLARVDDNNRRNKVLRARTLIYQKNYAVNTPQIQTILKDESLVPTSVSSGSLVRIYSH